MKIVIPNHNEIMKVPLVDSLNKNLTKHHTQILNSKRIVRLKKYLIQIQTNSA